MSRHLLAATALTGAAIIVLAGCSASGSAGTPQVSQWDGRGATASTASAGAAASATGTGQGARSGAGSGSGSGSTSGSGSGAGSTSNSYVAPSSIAFPVTEGDTWVYQTTGNGGVGGTGATGGAGGRITDKIISSGPATAGYQVVMSQTMTAGDSATYAEPVFLFYPNGTVGYPVPDVNGVSVEGNGVTWPDAAGLGSGRAYHSAVRLAVDKAGAIEDQNADVTVQGAGTTTVTVPAGTYRALVVTMTLSTKDNGVTTTVQVKTWLAANTGPVKSVVVTQVSGTSAISTTSVLLSFARGVSQADGS